MKLTSYLRTLVKGFVGEFVRQPDGKLECLGLTLGSSHRQIGEPIPEPYDPGHPKLRSRPAGAVTKAEAANRQAIVDHFLRDKVSAGPDSEVTARRCSVCGQPMFARMHDEPKHKNCLAGE